MPVTGAFLNIFPESPVEKPSSEALRNKPLQRETLDSRAPFIHPSKSLVD
jgi:hypothetical protein